MRKILIKVNDRYIPRFQLTTTILADERTGERRVEKRPLTKAAAKHVADMARTPALLQGILNGMAPAPCHMEGDAAVFPYLQGTTLLDKLLRAAEESRSAFLTLWQTYFDAIRPAEGAVCSFATTPAFEAAFGSGDAWTGESAYPRCAIDMLPSNVMAVEDGQLTLFDYEWLMEVPVPVKLILYHAINSCYTQHPALYRAASREEVFALAGVDRLADAGAAAEDCFYRYISTDENNPRPTWELYRSYEKPIEDDKQEIARLTDQLRSEENQRMTLAAESDMLHLRLYEANSREFLAQQEIARLQAETARQASELQLMQGSISWRLTCPLRAVKARLRRLL